VLLQVPMTSRGKPLRWLIEKSRYLTIVGVICLLAGAVEASLWGAIHAVEVWLAITQKQGYATGVVALLHVLDAFLVAPILLIVAVSIYELFIGPVNVPDVLKVSNLHGLKARFASMLILIMTVIFVEHVINWEDGRSTLLFGAAIALVSITLIAYSRWAEY
jgi:uncharacterized membrane protein YqhA